VGGSAVEQLIAIGSGPLAGTSSQPEAADRPQVSSMLAICDGFYAFESALHVFPSVTNGPERGVAGWNVAELWRDAFPSGNHGWYFFAEDAFACQFAVAPDSDSVSVMDPETGDFEVVAANIDGWARAVLDDFPRLTGYPLAHEWQAANGALRPARRLTPRVPFVLGGAFAVENLYEADTVSALRYRGELAAQIRDLPEGASVRLRVVD
jgi:hypothetical protein